MKVGDLVKYNLGSIFRNRPSGAMDTGIIVQVDDSHRQEVIDFLSPNGLVKGVWSKHLEVIDE